MYELINCEIKNKSSISEYLADIKYSDHDLVVKGQSTYEFYFSKEHKILFKEIIDTFIKLAGKDWYVLEFWTNWYGKGGFVKEHNHVAEEGVLKDVPQKSGVYYFKKPINSGNLILNKKIIEVKENDFILFDSKTMHKSQSNKTNEVRIIFSINLAYKVEKLGGKQTMRFYS